MLSLSFTPLVPTLVLAAVALLAAVAALVSILTRGVTGIVRTLALACLVIALANPSLVREEREPMKDIVAVVIDRSTSQTLGPRATQTNAAVEELRNRLGAMDRQIEARFATVTDNAGGGDGTRLFSALSDLLADVPSERVAGALLVTDGVVHDIPGSTALLGFNAPLHALVTGHEGERDRRIALLEAPRFGLIGKDQTIRLMVEERGGTGDATLTVRRDGQLLRTLTVATGRPFALPITIDHGGPNVVELEVDGLDGELTNANNRAVLTIEGIREKLRVLLISGEPHAGERTWRNLLKSDANVDLVHFTILRPPEKQDGTPINELSLIAFPTRELFQQKISEFDLIIFDRYANQSILPNIYYDNIARYVREGGALLVAAGPEFATAGSIARTALGPVLPAAPDGRVLEAPYKAEVTETGHRHPVTRALPGSETTPPSWGEWLRLVGAHVDTGSVLLSGSEERPLLVLLREGEGRVGMLLSDHAWLWARGYRNGGPHLDLLRRLAHWLMKEPALEEEALRANARGGEILIERQTMSDAPGPVVVTSPDGTTREVTLSGGEPGLFNAVTPAEQHGLYRLTSGDLAAFVNVGPENPRELTDVFSDTERLRPLAEATRGSVRRIASGMTDAVDLPRLTLVSSGSRFSGGDWIGLRASGSAVVRGVSVMPLGYGFLGLAFLLGAVLVVWLVEGRRRGLNDPDAAR
ncbi:hypothetical protein IMF23_19700 [Chelatococcus daeguensis]|uniref:hypothetical protein n=1 Tax=Chelatococcus daeguensis TaxID=444444 RepID=UPI0007AC00F6|nr:hypothetical protein [Chelatococcus daeguensis]KZE27451.1 hypothetical protein AVW15_10005 [Chelatococcus daeguensis]MBM3085668.1 hypothetical protein [Chelatococcus daeguensis]